MYLPMTVRAQNDTFRNLSTDTIIVHSMHLWYDPIFSVYVMKVKRRWFFFITQSTTNSFYVSNDLTSSLFLQLVTNVILFFVGPIMFLCFEFMILFRFIFSCHVDLLGSKLYIKSNRRDTNAPSRGYDPRMRSRILLVNSQRPSPSQPGWNCITKNGGPKENRTLHRCIASAPRPLGTCRPIFQQCSLLDRTNLFLINSQTRLTLTGIVEQRTLGRSPEIWTLTERVKASYAAITSATHKWCDFYCANSSSHPPVWSFIVWSQPRSACTFTTDNKKASETFVWEAFTFGYVA